ncbi:hypothetical protein FKP32DRAFT_1681936 [Trametes sanguinea]|nr:hypothetical protein FKP32DRAFT_1681936 [Trametes sanguinea]
MSISQSGRNVVKVNDVSGAIHPNSPRISGAPGGVRVVDVVCTKKPSGDDPTAEIGLVTKRGKALYAEREVRRQQIALLDDSARFFTTTRVRFTSAQAVAPEDKNETFEFVERYGHRKLALERAVQTLDEEIAQLEKKLAALRTTRKGDTSTVIATVVADRDVKAELKLTYLVSGVMWRPFYDLHATTVDGQPSRDVSMSYCATIVQCTGEDWNDATLTLSTADAQAQRHLSVPLLHPLKIKSGLLRAHNSGAPFGQSLAALTAGASQVGATPGTANPLEPSTSVVQATTLSAPHDSPSPFAPPKVVTEEGRTRTGPHFMSMSQLSTMNAAVTPPPRASASASASAPPPPPPPAPAPLSQSLVPSAPSQSLSRSALSVAYRIDGNVTIPSDGEKHRLTVALLKFKTKLSYMCVPRQCPTVYILSKVENTSEYHLLPVLFAEPVAQFISVNESFECVLGVDTSIKVSYRQDEKTEHEARRSFAEPQRTTTQTNITTVINRHNHDIPELIVRESVPLGSEEEKINIVLRKPAGLADAKDGQIILDRVETDDGEMVNAKVCWTEVVDGKGGEKDGMFEWIHAIPAGKKISFEAHWDVKSPSDAR